MREEKEMGEKRFEKDGGRGIKKEKIFIMTNVFYGRH